MTTFLLILIDQFVKYNISTHYLVGASKVIIPGTFNITYVENTGAAFSILSDNTYLIIILSLLILFVLWAYILKGDKYSGVKSLLVAGIVSNLIDRVFRGYVIDYLDFNIGGYNAPIFNLADILIVVGSIIFVLKALEEE